MINAVKKAYSIRIIETEIAELLDMLPALAINGAKGVGKTVSASRLAGSRLQLDEPNTAALISADLKIIDKNKKPVLIDEWQKIPAVWDFVRRQVDADFSPGRYILTGSAMPPKGVSLHSGAGRIVNVRMRPFSLQERELDKPLIGIGALLKHKPGSNFSGATKITLSDYAEEIISSGFPGIRPLAHRAQMAQLDGYIENIITKEFTEQGRELRRPDTFRRWLRAYAAATGGTASYETILRAATGGQANKPSPITTLDYRDTLSRLWILDQIEPWLPLASPFSGLGQTPKHFLVDPALSARALNITVDRLLKTPDTLLPALGPQDEKIMLGRLFESLIALSLQTYARANGAKLSHLRTSNGRHEVDFVIEKNNKLIGIEVKLSAVLNKNDVRHLNWLAETFTNYEVLKIVLTAGQHAFYRKEDDIYVIPAVLLGA